MLNDPCIENLRALKGVLLDMSDAVYATPLNVLSDSSIGQHVRHVLEFYLCLLHAQDSGIFNYDARQRDLELQTDCLLYTSPSPRDGLLSRMPSSA